MKYGQPRFAHCGVSHTSSDGALSYISFTLSEVKLKVEVPLSCRPCEVQLTDFENAAYSVFIVLLTRVILSLNLDFVMPLSKVDENFRRAQKRGAVLNQKFYFRLVNYGLPSIGRGYYAIELIKTNNLP